MRKLLRQDWEESERGWITRPDGCSLHITVADRDEFVRRYWAKMPSAVPEEYSRPVGQAYEVVVDDVKFEKVSKSEHGVRFYAVSSPSRS